MKLFQQMLVAGATLSLLTPVVAQAADINLEDMNSYSRSKKSKRFKTNFSNIQPSDWAFQSLKDLTKSRGCNFKINDEAISRSEAASMLKTCLSNVAKITPIERKLIDEFSPELAVIKENANSIDSIKEVLKLNNLFKE